MAFRPLSAAVLPMSVSAGPGSLAGRLVFPALRRASSFPLLAVASSSSASSSSYRLATSRRGYASALPPDTGKPGLTLAEEAKIKSERDAATQRANVAAVQQRMSTRAGRKILDENPVPIHMILAPQWPWSPLRAIQLFSTVFQQWGTGIATHYRTPRRFFAEFWSLVPSPWPSFLPLPWPRGAIRKQLDPDLEKMQATFDAYKRAEMMSDKTELIRLTHYPWRNDALKAAATRKPLTGAAWSRMDVAAPEVISFFRYDWIPSTSTSRGRGFTHALVRFQYQQTYTLPNKAPMTSTEDELVLFEQRSFDVSDAWRIRELGVERADIFARNVQMEVPKERMKKTEVEQQVERQIEHASKKGSQRA